MTVGASAVASPDVSSARPHAIVIGSGFGGLAEAIRLGARGYQVTVIEKLDEPGGRAYVHRQDGFVFDAGPTIVTVPFLFEELWSLCGRRFADDIDLRPMSPFYRIRFDDGSIVLTAPGRALNDAASGDTVRVVNLVSNLSLVGTAQADGTVEVTR